MVYQVNEKNFEQEVLAAKELVVVDFNAEWCGPCRMLGPVIEQLAEENQDVKFVSVNVDNSGELAQQFGIQSIPCVVFLKKGEEKTRNVGFAPKSVLENMIKELK